MIRNRAYASRGYAFKITICDLERRAGSNVKLPPLVFTEHGAIMAATVLNSPRAVKMTVVVAVPRNRRR